MRISNVSPITTLKNTSTADKKKITFVDSGSPGHSIYGRAVTLGIQILDHVAGEAGYSSQIFHMNETPIQDILSGVGENEVVALSATSPGHYNAIQAAKAARQQFGNKVLILKGGLHEEYVAEDLQKQDDYPIDFSFLGFADVSFSDFVQILNAAKTKDAKTIAAELDGINGIAYKGQSTGVVIPRLGPTQQVLPDVNYLQFTEPFTIFPDTKPGDLMFRVQDTRGCPEPCSFCGLKNETTRISVKRFVDYIGKVVEQKFLKGEIARYVFFETGTFLMDNRLDKKFVAELPMAGVYNSDEWIHEFIIQMGKLNQSLSKKYGLTLSFGTQTTIKSINPEIISNLQGVGLGGVFIGVETLDKATIKRMLTASKTGATGTAESQCIQAVDILNGLGVSSTCAAMVELGLEDKAVETVQALMAKRVHEIFIEYRAVYPGTPDAKRVVMVTDTGNVIELSPDDVAQRYSDCAINTTESPNPEDRSKMIVQDYDGRKLKTVDSDELRAASDDFYSELRSVAANEGYEVRNDGNYILQK